MLKIKPISKSNLENTAGMLIALSVALLSGGAQANEPAPAPWPGPMLSDAAFADPLLAEASGSAVEPALLLQVKSRGRSKGRGNRARSGRGGKSAFGRNGRSRADRHHRGHWKNRAHPRHRPNYRHAKRRHHQPFRFRGRVEECYTGRLIFPDLHACGHPYNYYYRK